MNPEEIKDLATNINRVAASAVQTSTAHLQAKIERLEREKAELVEACKDVILSAEYSDKVADFVSSCELGEAINRMRAALRKAEGKE